MVFVFPSRKQISQIPVPRRREPMNIQRFSNQTAIITGGTSGLGLSIAKRLLDEGASVFVFDCRAAEFAEFRDRAACLQVNVTNESEVQVAVQRVHTGHNRIDVLVNCAGVTGKTNLKSHEVDLADFDFVIRTNVYGSFLTSKHVLPIMVRQGYGR